MPLMDMEEIITLIKKKLSLKRITVELLWTPGHAGFNFLLQGNEKADQLAKEGVEEARSMPEETRTVTIQNVKAARQRV